MKRVPYVGLTAVKATYHESTIKTTIFTICVCVSYFYCLINLSIISTGSTCKYKNRPNICLWKNGIGWKRSYFNFRKNGIPTDPKIMTEYDFLFLQKRLPYSSLLMCNLKIFCFMKIVRFHDRIQQKVVHLKTKIWKRMKLKFEMWTVKEKRTRSENFNIFC